MNNTLKWIFKNGASATECESFPFAFRAMYHTVRHGVEAGKPFGELVKKMSIVSPAKDIHGQNRVYSYAAANEMAKNQGLLTPENTINSREFKR